MKGIKFNDNGIYQVFANPCNNKKKIQKFIKSLCIVYNLPSSPPASINKSIDLIDRYNVFDLGLLSIRSRLPFISLNSQSSSLTLYLLFFTAFVILHLPFFSSIYLSVCFFLSNLL